MKVSLSENRQTLATVFLMVYSLWAGLAAGFYAVGFLVSGLFGAGAAFLLWFASIPFLWRGHRWAYAVGLLGSAVFLLICYPAPRAVWDYSRGTYDGRPEFVGFAIFGILLGGIPALASLLLLLIARRPLLARARHPGMISQSAPAA